MEEWSNEMEEFLDRFEEIRSEVDGYIENKADIPESLLEEIDELAWDFNDTNGLVAEYLFDREDREAMTPEMLYQLINE